MIVKAIDQNGHPVHITVSPESGRKATLFIDVFSSRLPKRAINRVSIVLDERDAKLIIEDLQNATS